MLAILGFYPYLPTLLTFFGGILPNPIAFCECVDDFQILVSTPEQFLIVCYTSSPEYQFLHHQIATHHHPQIPFS